MGEREVYLQQVEECKPHEVPWEECVKILPTKEKESILKNREEYIEEAVKKAKERILKTEKEEGVVGVIIALSKTGLFYYPP